MYKISKHLNQRIQIEATVVNEEGRTKTTIDNSVIITSQPIELQFIKPDRTYIPSIKTRFTVSSLKSRMISL